MDEVLLRQLARQLKLLNFWISVMGTLILIAFAITLFMLFKVYSFVQDTSRQIDSIQDRTRSTLDVRQQICDSDSFGAALQKRSDVCKAE